MAPPEDEVADIRGVMERAFTSEDNDVHQDLGEAYDSSDEARQALIPKAKRSKKNREDDGGEEKGKAVGKNQVLKIVDQVGLMVESSFLRFLQGSQTITEEAKRCIDLGRKTLWVRFSDLSEADLDLASLISEDYIRFLPNLELAVQRFMASLDSTVVMNTSDDIIQTSVFHVSFHGLTFLDRIRDLRTDRLGQLLSFTGTVTRTSETRPELIVAVFECTACGSASDPVIQEFKYSEPPRCGCSKASNWQLVPTRSTFADWQKVRVQENATEIPAGSMPRSMEVICRHETVEVAKPGDKCVFTGSLIVVPDVSKLRAPGDPPGLSGSRLEGRRRNGEDQGVSGLTSLGVRDLTYRLAFLTCSVQPCDGADVTLDHGFDAGEVTREQVRQRVRETFSAEQLEELSMMAQQPNLMDKLKRSVAPAIYGHGDIKLGVLLLLFGGVHKKTPEGINLRGDINVCIVGDPSTAKSQFLRYVCGFDTRAVYTSGKASTAAGLTASVMRDAETGEFCIEAGALMLADNGVCCIDEFDKMDDIDQVAIHEAMEQQTISITKAGIQATLNARTSVLAAANPIHGRYDRSKTLKSNLTVGPAIMSRFDLFFVVLDECDEVNDRAIADHILEVHRARLTSGADFSAEPNVAGQRVFFSKDQLRRYVRYARTIDPEISPEVQPLLVDYYVRLRQGDNGVSQNKQAYRITVRQLEALIRLSEAIARMHLDDKIRPKYVESAYKLLRTSIVQVESESLVLSSEAEQPSTQNVVDEEDGQVIRQEDLQRVAALSQQYIQDRENASQDDDDFFGVPQTDLVEFLLENHPEGLDEQDLEPERKRLNRIIRVLVDTHTFIRDAPVPLGWDFSDDTPEDEKYLLQLHHSD